MYISSISELGQLKSVPVSKYRRDETCWALANISNKFYLFYIVVLFWNESNYEIEMAGSNTLEI